jgi:hypothetical protein
MESELHVYIFFGRENWSGFTPREPRSELLPPDKGPWRPYGTAWLILKRYPRSRIVDEDDIIAGIDEKGYHVAKVDIDAFKKELEASG